MASSPKLSLFSAIIISVNIMLGSGIFINTAILTKQSGSLGAVVYALVALLLLPLIFTIAQLLSHHHNAGTFYHFGLVLSPFFGFISGWSYFIAKLCSFALGIHVCMSFLQNIIPALAVISTLVLDSIIIVFFTLLNFLNLKIGQSIQFSFLGLKLVPIFFAIFSGLYLFSSSAFTAQSFMWSGISTSIPLVLFAFSGFETACSLSKCIQNPEKNGPKIIFISYGIVVTILILYQLLFFASLGTALGKLAAGYLSIFPALLGKFFSSNTIPPANIIKNCLHIGIASSSLGASYGIMYSNSWNLYTLAECNHIFGKKFFTALNIYNTPYGCIIAEGFLAIIYLFLSGGQQVPLQQVAALGSTIAYTSSSIALLFLLRRKYKAIKLMPILGLGSCLLFISSLVASVILKGFSSLLLLFLIIILFGTFMFWRKHDQNDPLEIFEKL